MRIRTQVYTRDTRGITDHRLNKTKGVTNTISLSRTHELYEIVIFSGSFLSTALEHTYKKDFYCFLGYELFVNLNRFFTRLPFSSHTALRFIASAAAIY